MPKVFWPSGNTLDILYIQGHLHFTEDAVVDYHYLR